MSNENDYEVVSIRVSNKQVSVATLALVGSILGYPIYVNPSHGEESGGISHQHYIEIKHEVDEIKQSLALVKREVAMVETMTSDHINGGKK